MPNKCPICNIIAGWLAVTDEKMEPESSLTLNGQDWIWLDLTGLLGTLHNYMSTCGASLSVMTGNNLIWLDWFGGKAALLNFKRIFPGKKWSAPNHSISSMVLLRWIIKNLKSYSGSIILPICCFLLLLLHKSYSSPNTLNPQVTMMQFSCATIIYESNYFYCQPIISPSLLLDVR